MTTTAYAAVLHGVDSPFVFEDIVLDDLKGNELLVKIVAAGLCHTDLAVQHGHMPRPFPSVLGHEGAGIVEQVGANVTEYAVGDHVAISFASCGHCVNCLEGREAYCLNAGLLNVAGVREDGTGTMTAADGGEMHGAFFGQSSFASYSIVAERNAVKISKDISLDLVGPLGCGIQTGAGTVLNSLAVPAGASIVVSGTGAVGLSAIMAAKAAGATTIIAVDVLEERLAFASKLGATHIINGKTDDTVAKIMEITDGIGAAFAVDTTAVPAVVQNVITATRPGGSIALVGVGRPDAVIPLGLITAAGKTIIGALEGDSVPQIFIPRLLAMHEAGTFPFDELITTYPFDQLEQAIADTASGAAVKAVLTMP